MDPKTLKMSARLRPLEFKPDGELSEASILRDAQSLLPESFDLVNNQDLMPVVFDLAVVNEFNINHDGVDTDTAIAFVKNFAHKPINTEHIKSNIVGHILNASITEKPFEYQDNDLEQFKGRTDKLYITAVGVIYRHVFEDLAKQIADHFETTEFNFYDLTLSASWELAFSNYQIAKGSKDLSECEVFDDDEEGTYKAMLPTKGGTGYDDKDVRINRLIRMPIIPVGAAFTFDPAADVSGVEEVVEGTNDKYIALAKKLTEKNSPEQQKTVSRENALDMDPKELTSKIEEAVASALQTSDASSARNIIAQTLEEHSKTWKSKVDVEAEAKKKAEESLAEVQKDLAETKETLQKMQDEANAAKAVEKFNERMNVITDAYDLSDKESKFVASEVRELSVDDEAFASYSDKLATVFSHKSKEAQEEAKKAFEAKLDEAVAAKLKEKGIEVETPKAELNTEEAEANVTNNNHGQEQKSLYDLAKESFEAEIK